MASQLCGREKCKLILRNSWDIFRRQFPFKYIRVSNATPKGAEQIVPMGNMLIGIWYSTPLSTTFQLFLGCRLFLVERTGVPREKKTDLQEITAKLDHIMLYRVTGFELTILVVIDIDCTCGCESGTQYFCSIQKERNISYCLINK